MHTRSQDIVLLIVVIVLALTLTAVMSSASLARSNFQSSPILPTDTPGVPPPDASATITETPVETPTEAVLQLTPTFPEPMATQPPAGPVTPPGFLPAPTLTNPDALLPLPAAAQPPLVGPAAPPIETVSDPPAAAAEVPSVAQLIDNSIVALSYVWLCCGALLLSALALVVAWLARRATRR